MNPNLILPLSVEVIVIAFAFVFVFIICESKNERKCRIMCDGLKSMI